METNTNTTNQDTNQEDIMTDTNNTETEQEPTVTLAESIQHIVDELVTEERYTPYAIHTLTKNLNVEVRPQMMYNYCRNGMFKSANTTSSPDGKITVSADEVKKYLVRRLTKATA